jgi:endonuclease/exonuclease/phosphatase (EEP) superfamily protein YafD
MAATAISLAPTDDWWVRLFDMLRPPVAALLAVALLAVPPLLDVRRASTRALVAGLVLALGIQLSWLLPLTPLHPPEAASAARCAPEDRLSLVVANLRASANGAGPFLRQVRRADPDLVFAVEIDPGWAEALAPLAMRYSHQFVHPRADYWGFALYSRLPLVRPEARRLLSEYVPSLRTGVRLPSGATVDLQGLHPRPPLPSEGTGERDAELLLAAEAAREGRADAAIVAGDLNAVSWSRSVRLMLRIGGLRDPRVGRGPIPSFPVWLPQALRIPLDHALVSPAFDVASYETLADVGSDHLPLLVRLCLSAPGAVAPPPTVAELRRAREAVADGREDVDPLRMRE